MSAFSQDEYRKLLEEAVNYHGHKCAGIESGTRMTMCALERVGIADPKGADRKKLLVFVEVDRCATDAITALTGCQPGKRTMKVLDYGKMAATFVNLDTGKAVRLASNMGKQEAPDGTSIMPDFTTATDDELFIIQDVEVPLRPEDLPGKPVRKATCSKCGEKVMDGREVEVDGRPLCKPCAEDRTYYRAIA
ncbi:formylmethanofuran dehydrogenase [Geobacter sp. FeAm09]|uniref:FmdE family protein n=1 Tax=Geobacter sp. FeAm09 TaxID=2597769 RepID=UPI0011EEEC2D|nr:FmdE family protein [Geobacter sp. FeAm09]QEM68961.1 formylmethanofuran dehydrogenase [Geobacter sp. FeAm09]